MNFRLIIILLISVFIVITWWKTSPITSDVYHFFVVNNKLFALRDKGSYGTGAGLISTEDEGVTWSDYDAPEKTRVMCGRNDDFFALTSNAEVYKKISNSDGWEQIWADQSYRYTYDIACMDNGDIYVIALDTVIAISPSGEIIHKYHLNHETACHKALVVDERYLILSCSPYRLVVVDVAKLRLINWGDGLVEAPDDGHTGPIRVRKHGDKFLACTRDGVYIANRLMGEWKILTDEFRVEGLRQIFCRDLESINSKDQWLVADGAGVHLMEAGKKRDLVFPDEYSEHSLILGITFFKSSYFVSFARLNGSIGVKISNDLKSWSSIKTDK